MERSSSMFVPAGVAVAALAAVRSGLDMIASHVDAGVTWELGDAESISGMLGGE